MTIATETPPRRHRPSFGRSPSVRGYDLFDTPPKALGPLFAHEPLLQGVTSIGEHFAGIGNLVTPMRARGITVHASDILDRGCPDCSVEDFFAMTAPPPGCRLELSNPPFRRAMEAIEHAFDIGFDVVVFLLKLQFLCTADRYERLHKPGHLRRMHVLAERLQDMHDAAHIEAGGDKAGQSQTHAWFVSTGTTADPQSCVNQRAPRAHALGGDRSGGDTVKPTPADVIKAIEMAAGEWFDPAELAPTYWSCELYDPQGRPVGDGQADAPGLAMALAWMACQSPDALIDGEVLDDVPLVVPDGWHVELAPPAWRGLP